MSDYQIIRWTDGLGDEGWPEPPVVLPLGPGVACALVWHQRRGHPPVWSGVVIQKDPPPDFRPAGGGLSVGRTILLTPEQLGLPPEPPGPRPTTEYRIVSVDADEGAITLADAERQVSAESGT